jgi:uncharacterized metal-binding protein
MPDGPVHDGITGVMALTGAAVIFYDTSEWRLATVYAASTLASGLVLSPDLDLHSESYKRWGFLRFIWWPYKTALPHRHFLSHGFVIGMLTRVVYFHVMVGALITTSLYLWHMVWMEENVQILEEMMSVYQSWHSLYTAIPPLYRLASVVGLLAGSESHIAADFTWSLLRKSWVGRLFRWDKRKIPEYR